MMRTLPGLILTALLLAGCGTAARRPVVIEPEHIVLAPGEEFHSARDFAPAYGEWQTDSYPLVASAVRRELAKESDGIVATVRGMYPADREINFPAGWVGAVRTGPALVSPAGDRFLVETLLPATVRVPSGLQLWLQYNLTRERPEYLYFVER